MSDPRDRVPRHVRQLVAEAGGVIQSAGGPLPDGSGYCTASLPLPSDHWLYADGRESPPAPLRVGTADPRRAELALQIRDAARCAIRRATMNGTVEDFDPDALVQNFVVAMLGYWTADGRSDDD